ncbi:MAG: PD40 domain-containing protein [Proteobacteria bacterium]|nr:PD40 domain-containing protein [Pseudomonadota bacterium]
MVAKSTATLLSAMFVVAACSSGDGVSIGTGQDADPVVIDFPIAYVRAPLPVDNQGEFAQADLREQLTFDFGADLFFRDRAAPSASAVNITGAITNGLGAVRDIEMAFDGSSIIFSMRTPIDVNLAIDDEDQPTWNIWVYTFAGDTLSRVIASDLTAEFGHDVGPHYLPDGRIIFSSTRQLRSNAILLDESKPQFAAQDEDDNEPAFVLHVMGTDGSNIEQVSYNQSHDFDPAVLSNGQIVFSRWDHAGPANDAVNLYRMNPDGSQLELLFGQNSHATGTNGETVQFMQPRELEDGRIMVLVRPFTDTDGGGDIVIIDTPVYLENMQPTKDNLGMGGPAITPGTINQVSTETGVPSPGGRYGSVYPIQDGTGRLLVSWSQCRLTDVVDPAPAARIFLPCTAENLADTQLEAADPIYGIWMYDPRDDTQLPIVVAEEGFIFTEVVSADPRPTPPVILDQENMFLADPNLVSEAAGVISIRSVYDFDGGAVADINSLADPSVTMAAGRPARFLRIVKPVSQPNDDLLDIDNTAFGVSTAQGMREILGYVPIEPDGSVMVKVPANVAFGISVVDADGRRITARHQNWMQVRPGQLLECNGCHVAQGGLSHGRFDAFDSAWEGAATPGNSFYPSTVDALFVGDLGETMAEVRARISCGGPDNCASIVPSMDIEYTDVWTDEIKAGRAVDQPFSYAYLDLDTVPPTSLNCLTQPWAANCRIVINYETHIDPLWSVARPVLDDLGNPLLDGNGDPVTNDCTNCHNIVDLAGVTIVPAGQLDLSAGISDLEPDHFKSYQELMSTDTELELDAGGNLIERLVQVDVDPITGEPIFAPVNVGPSMRVAGANASNRFFARFEADPIHGGILSNAEKRLIAEWLDVGAQYYNNPFDAPAN